MTWHHLFLIACLVAPLAACDHPPEDSATDTVRVRLVGTWLRAYDEAGTRVRRVLVLESDGSFHERSAVVSVDTAVPRESHGSGTWLFDGTNLKRHYRLVNGQPVSAPTVPFATFELRFTSRAEFVGVDRIRGRQVTYQRVAEGTLP